MRGADGEIGTMTRKEAATGKRTESGRETGPRSGEVEVRQKRKNTKTTKMKGGIEMTKKIPRKRRNTVGAEAERGSTEAGAEAEMQGSGAGAGAKRSPVSIKTKARRSPTREAEVGAKEELTVLKNRENGSVVPAKKNLESAVEAKNVPTKEITVIVRTNPTNTIEGGAKA